MQVGDDYVREVIHAFSERGLDALDPKWSGGRPPAISERVREHICLIAKTVPAEWGITGMSTWSLKTLAEHLIAQGMVAAISTVGRRSQGRWRTERPSWSGRFPRSPLPPRCSPRSSGR
ncbi:helix-turn-helix domain-containing protein [Streptosporangium subroseum]|uniref:helix-turn-helix domain-containing protein n=1 Tax=Streptosporangium subroseum TaxID=106412 RepID=UPI001C52B910|nr:helix-turn-helix domain-containing protein [Streptosporangium subroseum]